MKMKLWVLSTCIPEDCRPCFPHAYGTEAEALAAFERFMMEEWEHNAPLDDEGEPMPFPDGDPEEANRLMANPSDRWGEWELTGQEIDVPAPEPFRDLLELAKGLDVFQDDYRMNAVLRACEAIVEGRANG